MRVSLATCGIALLVSGCRTLERKAIFPGSATQGNGSAFVGTSAAHELLDLCLHDGTRIKAQFGAAQTLDGRPLSDPHTRPTVLFFYGNGMCMAWCEEQFDQFRRLGVNVLIPEYPGYGMSEGKPSEAGFYAAANAAYEHLLTRKDIDPEKIVAAGWSIGAAVAIDLAARKPVKRLITVSAFTSMPEVERAIAPWLPLSVIFRPRFDNLAKIKNVSCPLLLVHGIQDTLVPFKMAQRLRAAATSPVEQLDLAAAGHNDVFSVGGARLWNEIGRFLAGMNAGE